METLTQDEIARMSPPDRLALIEQLWDSLDDSDLLVSDAQKTELDRRLESLEQDRKEGVSWAGLKTELEQRCP